MVQVEDDASLLVLREGIAMYTYTWGSGKLCLHLIIVEHYFVIARYGFFRIV